jgi:hypothetical protein
MALKPWYRIEGLVPRADLREGKPLDAAEFAVHLDQVRDKRAPEDYQDPIRFLERTYLTKYLTELASQVVRRLSGEKTGTSAIFNLSTQFGGGKTHALTLLYHLAKNGAKANNWTGVNKILAQAKINTIPQAAIAVFVGTEFDSITGRGGNDGTPLRKTPWGEIAYQLGGEEAFNKVKIHEQEFTEPKGDVIRSLFPQDRPCLILMDEIINYVSTYRHKDYHNKLYNFIHALRLDKEAQKDLKKARLHRKVATTIFFESNGGQAQAEATIPEIRLAVSEPDLDIANLETVLDALASECYYLLINQNKYRFSISPNLNKILADRRANITNSRIEKQIKEEITKIFSSNTGLPLVFFPEKSNSLPNQPILTLAVLNPDYSYQNPETTILIESLIKEAGNSARTYKSALLFALADNDTQLRQDARKLLAWEDIRDQETGLSNDQIKALKESLSKAQRDLKETVWRSYKYLALLGRDNQVQILDLGQVNSSQASSMVQLIINRLRANGELEDSIHPRFLIRNWSPAFKEWTTKNVRDAFFASPQFPRLLKADAVKEAIARGVREGLLAYVGNITANQYQPFEFKNPNFKASDVEITDDLAILKGEEAENYLLRITDPPKLTKLLISPPEIKLQPESQYTFTVTGQDQYDQNYPLETVTWTTTGGEISQNGVLTTGNQPGSFIITAIVNEINTEARFTVIAPKTSVTEPKGDYQTTPTINQPLGIAWQGEITPQKWMQFYTKVVSSFTTNKDLNLKLEVKFSLEGELLDHQINDIKVKLSELGLKSELEDL